MLHISGKVKRVFTLGRPHLLVAALLFFGHGCVATNHLAEVSHKGANVVEWGADPHGNSDSAAAIQRAIDDSGGAIFFPRGTYLVGRRVTLKSGVHLHSNRDAVLKASPSLKDGMFWTRVGSRDVSFRDLTFDSSAQGTPPDGQAWDLVTIAQSDNILIENCQFTGGKTYGGDSHIMLGNSSQVRILGCTFEYASDQGIYVSGEKTSGIIIANSHFVHCGDGPPQEGYCIGITRNATDTLVQANVFEHARKGIQHDMGYSGRSLIIGNTFRKITDRCVGLRFSDYSVMANNRFDCSSLDDGKEAVLLEGTSFCALTGNVFDARKRSMATGIAFADYKVREADQGFPHSPPRKLNEQVFSRSNSVSGNVFRDVQVGILEQGGSTGNVFRYEEKQLPTDIELNVRP
jgi:hypothetical protein